MHWPALSAKSFGADADSPLRVRDRSRGDSGTGGADASFDAEDQLFTPTRGSIAPWYVGKRESVMKEDTW